MIDFEKDQEQVLDKTTNINKLADKIKELQASQLELQRQEDAIKQKLIVIAGSHCSALNLVLGHNVSRFKQIEKQMLKCILI